ncbi:glycoside hydrolase family 9 protein [Tellurirhabdus rosea]|uniref:glycoside hydrolase family 9 protein n=1 Tax=Tellurirhabdus rosea TaxID=2674997 RepID=UPI00224F2E3F|nr:glycoside hydrolase family 9 protein [Tellurirhabdus rosea]
MKKFLLVVVLAILSFAFIPTEEETAWIRINQLGYRPAGLKVAVWGSKTADTLTRFQLLEATSGKVAFDGPVSEPYGAYGPFRQTYRFNFSSHTKPGKYYLQAGGVRSPEFTIAENVYDGTADFCLRYMRQQRSGYNPFLKDSCHTHDGYTMYGPMPDSTHIDVSGGWHDASDYLQYVPTSANATYHLLAAFRDFPKAFGDKHLANGLSGPNGLADVLDEARWGLDWLLKMHPTDEWMFNQLGDDRDHASLRLPKEDELYGKGFERPVYFATGQPQGLFKHKNRATGVASTAGKFSSAFALGYQLFRSRNVFYAEQLWRRSQSAYTLGLQKPGNCQTAPGKAPYFYEEDNYVDDMELAAAELFNAARIRGRKAADYLNSSYAYALIEPVTPWIGADTARHYQWYPFINLGHYELAKKLDPARKKHIVAYYKEGIEKVWSRAKGNAFFRGVPFIWCSNNLTTSFAIQCYWYRKLTGDNTYIGLEQACFDWIFGCNPWGTSFVYGLPAGGDTPADPHSAFTRIGKFPVDGGLVDGPVYGSIFKNLIGLKLYEPDEYAAFQSDLVVYHDDFGDYSTNEPTMDGTASLVYLLAARQSDTRPGVAPAPAKPVAKPKVQPKKRSSKSKSRGRSSSSKKRRRR